MDHTVLWGKSDNLQTYYKNLIKDIKIKATQRTKQDGKI